MPPDSRILDLRRRVQADPASIAFAQLGEELRRVGAFEEAVDVCRSGLSRHPAYLSARVTLGRALIELDHLDDALAELGIVVSSASDNLAAIRGLAEIHQRRGEMSKALGYYRRALELARHDPELEEAVERMEKEVAPPAPIAAPEAATSIEALFDFDRLVEQLNAGPVAEVPPAAEGQPALADPAAGVAALSAPAVDPAGASDDPFSRLEAELRQHQPRPQPRSPEGSEPDPEDAQAAVLGELEQWLQALRTSSR